MPDTLLLRTAVAAFGDGRRVSAWRARPFGCVRIHRDGAQPREPRTRPMIYGHGQAQRRPATNVSSAPARPAATPIRDLLAQVSRDRRIRRHALPEHKINLSRGPPTRASAGRWPGALTNGPALPARQRTGPPSTATAATPVRAALHSRHWRLSRKAVRCPAIRKRPRPGGGARVAARARGPAGARSGMRDGVAREPQRRGVAREPWRRGVGPQARAPRCGPASLGAAVWAREP
jgi:hypothetical protein